MKMEEITKDTLNKLNVMPAEELIKWAFENFGDRAAIGTSFQLTGAVIIDLASRQLKRFRVFTIDTLRLHPETYGAIKAAEEKYRLNIERYTPDKGLLKGMLERFGEYSFFMDTEKIWQYIKENNLPYNKLFDMGYDSIGCIICSTPLVKGESPRSGRWRWVSKENDNKECGIPTNTIKK